MNHTALSPKKLKLAAVTARLAYQGVKRAALRATFHTVPWPRATALRVVQLSDFHVGWSTPSWLLDEAASLTAAAQPDVVVLTGDYVNHSLSSVNRLQDFVRRLPQPCLAVLGNHDHWAGAEAIERSLGECEVRVLRNDNLTLAGGLDLTVVGVDDGITGNHQVQRAFDGIAASRPRLVLSHAPRIAPEIAEYGTSLILSGHTHGGQVHLPKVTPAAMRLFREPYQQGWYSLGEARLYVNAGLGHSRRGLRLGSKAAAEIAVFDLRPQDSPWRG